MVRKVSALISFMIIATFGGVLGALLFGVANPLVFLYGWVVFGFASYITDLILEKE